MNSHHEYIASLSHILSTCHQCCPFIIYGIDKDKAKKAKWRISEATLLTMAAVGGSIGAWLGMKAWHHKTQHRKFKYGVPIILLIQIALMIYFHLNH